VTAGRRAGRTRHALLVLGVALAALGAAGKEGGAGQLDFASAEQAVDALVAAVRKSDSEQTIRILGPDGEKLVHSGDKVADREGRERFVKAYDAAHRLELEGEDSATLVVGPENWSLPIPLIRVNTRWHFDTVASARKIIDRRVGRNELNVIEVCRAYVVAQREYAAQDPAGSGLREYAQRFASSPGKRDGLYWDSAGEEQSPLGPLVAKAHAEGYGNDARGFKPSPYHGYFYRILTGQGAHAPGGARNDLVDGHMRRGYAMIAFPARWGDSGIMTFIVNQDGIVFQKNLGPDTKQLARAITEYDPDPSWSAP
jgi:hypothetical protein